jgi:hypothetical protein
METGTLIVIGGVTVGFVTILIYGGLALFYPEWVGITGKVAIDAEKGHTEGSNITQHGNITDKF